MFDILVNVNCGGNMYFPILHLPRVELRCKLQEELHRVTGPLVVSATVLLQIYNTPKLNSQTTFGRIS